MIYSIIEKKSIYYPDIERVIVDYELLGNYKNNFHLNVASTVLCSAFAQNAIKDAINLNCEYAVAQLMTPGMAKGLSEKMGFKNYCRLLPFLKDPRVVTGI